MDSGKEWKPSETGKGDKLDKPGPMRLGRKKPATLIHPVVGDHLKMEDDPDIDEGPGKMEEVNHLSSRLFGMYYPKSGINDMNLGPLGL